MRILGVGILLNGVFCSLCAGTLEPEILHDFRAGGRFPYGNLSVRAEPFRVWTAEDSSVPVQSWTLLTSGAFDETGRFDILDTTVPVPKAHFYKLSLP